MESNFTIIEASEFAQDEYGHCYGSRTLTISKEDIEALLNGKQLAWDDGEYTTFILFEDTELNTEVNTHLHDKPILIHDWKELLALPPNDKYKIVDIDGHGYNAWIMPIEETEETEKNWGKHHVYLSTHTFYGKTYEYSTKLLQEHGFDVEIDNWDKEEE